MKAVDRKDAEVSRLLRQTIALHGGIDNAIAIPEDDLRASVEALQEANQIVKRSRGRPELPDSERTAPTTVRLTPAEKAWCESQPGGLSKYLKTFINADRKRKAKARSS